MDQNVSQIRPLSLAILIVSLFAKIIELTYPEKTLTIKNHNEHVILNFVEIVGSFLFFMLSSYALKVKNWSDNNKRILTLAFVGFVLLITLSTSYIVSSFNTKNTITMLLIGVVIVGFFFVLEYKQILFTAVILATVYFLSMILPKISFEDKLLNTIIGLVLGFFLVSISRFNYYYKSQNFVKLKQLEEKNIEIELLNKEKENILHFVAHDLRSPLNNIEALSSLLIKSEEAELIANSAKQAKEIINDLLQGVESNQSYLSMKEVNISPKLSSIAHKWITNTKRDINFTDRTKNALVKVNLSKLERVLDNLIYNSIKFSADHQPINLTLTTSAKDLSIKIQDFGIGIPKNLQENIYAQYSKSGRAGLKGEKSTGLGLHISKKIIEEHHGRLLMESEEDKGTTFEILLPLI